jgi:chromosomal replication initiator protein
MEKQIFETNWEKILNNLKNQVGEKVFKVWFSSLQPAYLNEDVLTLEVPSKFVKSWLERKFNQLILRTIKEFIPEIRSIDFKISNTNFNLKLTKNKKIIKKFFDNQLSIFEINPQTNLNPRYKFDNFVVGPNNELAFAACQAVVKNYGKIHNPLFIYGPVGVGKTHLLQATGNEALKIYKNIKIKYLTTEEFTNDFIQSLKNHTTDEFKKKFRDVDILILDDVQFLSGKNTSQEELFHTFNYLYNLSKQIIFSSDRPPKLIPDIEERLRSRFEGGLVVDINPPDYETRIAILKLKSQEKSVIFNDEIYDLIAKKITNNIRELEGVLSLIIFYYQKGEKITLSKVEEIIKKFNRTLHKNINHKKVIKILSEHFEIKEDDFFKRTRTKHYVKLRKLLIYFLREITQMSYTDIAELFKKDHTTIIYLYEKIVEEISKNPELSQEIEILKNKILET